MKIKKTTKQHRADGIYDISYNELVNGSACHTARMEFLEYARERFGGGTASDKRVPVTLELLTRIQRQTGTGSWMMSRMRWAGKITDKEYMHGQISYARTRGVEEACVAMMDLLATRARREGRLT